jgi:TonB family protein
MMLLAIALTAAELPTQDAPAPRACTPPPSGQNSWVTNDDYPAAALRARQEGVVEFILDVGVDGCATACRVERSSGYPLLDQATCSLMVRRARFKPAQDAKGNPMTSTWSSNFKWMIPPEYPIAPEPWMRHAVATYSDEGRLQACTDSGDAAQTHLARLCQFATRISPANLAILRKGRRGSFTVLMEGAGRFDGQAAVPVSHPGELVGKLTVNFAIDADGEISTCDARDETPAAVAGKFRNGCQFLTESYFPTFDAAGKPVPRKGSIAIVYTIREDVP